MKMRPTILLILIITLALSSCISGKDLSPAPDQGSQAGDGIPEAQVPTSTTEPTQIPTKTPKPSATPVVVSPPDPVMIEFQAADGELLQGTYYPGSENPSPVIVLMNWARGDQSDWDPIARWLQGRGTLVREPDYNRSWKSSDWYPELDLNIPLGVFTFDFRNCHEGCQAYQPAGWLLDAQAAMQAAAGLEGIDPERMITAGASIGADAALDSCAWLNQNQLGTCLGSFTLSPGSFLTESYRVRVVQLRSIVPDAPVYCLYGLRDDASVETCEGAPDVLPVNYGYVEKHGMELIQPGQNPDPLMLLQEFIQITVGEVP
ncbi:MAG: hypothetical protein AB8I40_01165 [Anaerolineales bacterium]